MYTVPPFFVHIILMYIYTASYSILLGPLAPSLCCVLHRDLFLLLVVQIYSHCIVHNTFHPFNNVFAIVLFRYSCLAVT